ncbi:MAG: hypothetical protein ABI893_04595 [Polaromonas sp.]|uniref:hypothetical protein n=1 Tax=Polaromonas sp. TaxID=1869339 RepID=UPI003264DF42
MANDRDKHAAAVVLFVGVLTLSKAEAAALADEGHTTIEKIAYVPLSELFQVNGITRERILEIRKKAEKCLTPGQSL